MEKGEIFNEKDMCVESSSIWELILNLDIPMLGLVIAAILVVVFFIALPYKAGIKEAKSYSKEQKRLLWLAVIIFIVCILLSMFGIPVDNGFAILVSIATLFWSLGDVQQQMAELEGKSGVFGRSLQFVSILLFISLIPYLVWDLFGNPRLFCGIDSNNFSVIALAVTLISIVISSEIQHRKIINEIKNGNPSEKE
ncbi:hypothetical protein J7E38_00075 [Bacillus sp. ISL-35]|uniref:hypothetical protein n=1 Tax=Bacillus sp. ISL-35 TaxID=2819122 RepID=UPI001BEB1054|nr:hypothetical protein [Bacillus sp. ISL-35]MBT2677371.1 hypothetical protein [Bacillus sp. ISL-35]MBT2702242.1 hypothetical protein [Chryseobacterium sp. ISL-80]